MNCNLLQRQANNKQVDSYIITYLHEKVTTRQQKQDQNDKIKIYNTIKTKEEEKIEKKNR